jgi:hypothetical protein
MENVFSLAEFSTALFASFAVALLAAKACLDGLLRVMAGRR